MKPFRTVIINKPLSNISDHYIQQHLPDKTTNISGHYMPMVTASTKPHECNWKNNVNKTFSGHKNQDLPQYGGNPKETTWLDHSSQAKFYKLMKLETTFTVDIDYILTIFSASSLLLAVLGGLLDAALRKPRFARPAEVGLRRIHSRGVYHRGVKNNHCCEQPRII